MKKPEHLKVPLKVIPEPQPNTRMVFLLQGLFPAFKGRGDIVIPVNSLYALNAER